MSRTPALLLVLLTCFPVMAAAGPGELGDESACSRLAALIHESTALSLPARVERAFMLTLIEADSAAHNGDRLKALTYLRTVTVEVRGAKRVDRVRPQAADVLIAKAREAMEALAPPLNVSRR